MVRIINDEKWAPVIGKLFIAFGTIEGCVNTLLKEWCSAKTFAHVIADPLERRVSLLKSLAFEQNIGEHNREVLIVNLNDVLAIATTRNLIAHNPLVMTIYLDDASNPALLEVVRSERSEKTIEFDKLVAIGNRAKRLADALSQNSIDLKMHGVTNAFVADGRPHEAHAERA